MEPQIQPVKTERALDKTYDEQPPSLEERLEALTEAVETALTTPVQAPERQTVLDRLRELRERGRGPRSSREKQ